ncbi:MAG TPA: serine/threonine-protein kinase [Polyangiaceae bacterium]|nr:serine/threonine-protein kinase [Polyangiaceae bacterium]
MSQPAGDTEAASESGTSGTRVKAQSAPEHAASAAGEPLRVGRYVVGERIAAGGMATVHIGRLRGAAGFSRTVAIKRLLPQFASAPEFESLFVHEARLVARIQHPNVVSTLDVVAEAGELLLVMDYVAGEALARLLQAAAERDAGIPQPVALSIVRDALCGLHAAHEAKDRRGTPLDVVHRDVSPQNLMVGSDGVTRVLDFGIAKAASSVEITREGLVRGKTAYMAPEQIFCEKITRRADIYSVGVVLWEMLVGERLFPGGVRPELAGKDGAVASPRERGARTDPKLDAIVLRALASNEAQRFETALEMAEQLAGFELASREQVQAWVRATADEVLTKRAALVARLESADTSLMPPPATQREWPRAPGLQSDLLTPPWAHREPPASAARDGAASVPERDITPAVAPAASSRARRVKWLAVAALGAFAAAVGVASAWRGTGEPAATPPGAAAPAVTTPTSTPVAAPAAVAAPTSAPVAAPNEALEKKPARPLTNDSDPPIENSVDTADPALDAPGAAGQQRAAHVARKPSARARSKPSKAKLDCNPPYSVDSAGRRRYKPECF